MALPSNRPLIILSRIDGAIHRSPPPDFSDEPSDPGVIDLGASVSVGDALASRKVVVGAAARTESGHDQQEASK